MDSVSIKGKHAVSDIRDFLEERPLESAKCFGIWDIVMKRCSCSTCSIPHKEFHGSMTFECCRCGKVTDDILE